jgi:two-component system, NtrC family, response regulator AtoC
MVKPQNHTNAAILVVDDDRAFRIATSAVLTDEGYRVTTVETPDAAIREMQSHAYDLVLSDLVMEGMDGIELLGHIRNVSPETLIVMITGFGSIETAVQAMKSGAFDYLTKPCNNDELRIKVRRAIEYKSNKAALSTLREEVHKLYTFHNIKSRNGKMREIFGLVRKVAETDVTVLIRGETGTGKELIAKAIHYTSPRSDHTLATVNCSTIPDQLFESELFGYERGAFTGAHKTRRGRAEEAHNGTLFLDEIGYIPLPVQTKLLRFLQDKTFERVGGNDPITSNARIIAATNQPLEEMVAGGTFREDVFYRLNIFPITLPPLRERIEDIPLLAEDFVEKYSKLYGSPVSKISPSVVSSLMNHSWKGNVRELENIIKRAIIKTEGDCITAVDIPSFTGKSEDNVKPKLPDIADAIESDIPFKSYMKNITSDAEMKYLITALKKHNGNINRVARMMGLDRKTIYRKMTEYSIDAGAFRRTKSE